MTKHLFIEGPVESGKSTLLKTCLKPYFDVTGGFSCIRYRDADGNVRAYALAPPATAVDAVFNPDITPDDRSVFLLFDKENRVERRLEVFETRGLEFLNGRAKGLEDVSIPFSRADSAAKKKTSVDSNKTAGLIYMDEIGGVELMAPKFCKRLYELLGGNVPCMGILKMNTGKGILKQSDRKKSVEDLNEELRKALIERFDAKIIKFVPEDKEKARIEIEDFIKSKLPSAVK